MLNVPKNQIFMGPSGCSKTYNIIVETLRILGSQLIKEDPNYQYSKEEYNQLIDEFDEKKRSGEIEVISFHDSYSYIDFIEGSKLDIRNGRDAAGYEMNFIDRSGCFKKIAQKALFECIDLPLMKKLQIFSFAKILEYFKELYPLGSVFDIESSAFEIVRYTNKAIVIKPKSQSVMVELLYEPLAQLLEKNIEREIQGKEIKEILEPYKGTTAFYNTIFLKLCDLYESAKVQLIEEFYRGSYTLKTENIKPFVLIIEEIDNCNISKVFGELISLLDEDKRSKRVVRLPYSQEKFMIPENLYIIGTITSPTYSTDLKNWNILLRKFSFKSHKPDSKLVADFGCNFKEKFKLMNERIAFLIGEGYQIGHGFFINEKYADADINTLRELWFRHVYPRLRLYFKDDFMKMQMLLGSAQNNNCSFIKTMNNVNLPKNCSFDTTPRFMLAEDTEDFDFAQALDYAFS